MKKFILSLALTVAAFAQTSTPSAPAQPPTAVYSPSALQEFVTYTRASYQAAFGVQAPPFNASQAPRSWFDTSSNPGPYQVVQSNPGATPPAALVSLPVPAGVNLPNLVGAYQYPAYVNLPATTVAVFQWPGIGGTTPIPVSNICSLSDANLVAASMANSSTPLASTSIGIDAAYAQNAVWGAETRRPYTVTVGTTTYDVCPLVVAMSHVVTQNGQYVSGGYGSPGVWSNLNSGAPTWVSTPDPGLTTTTTPVPVPVRSLLPGEQFQLGLLNSLQVVNTNAQPITPSAGASLSQNQLNFILQVVEKLDSMMGLGIAVPAN
ncbi:MAG: hypothetical protein KGL39_26160 [Patescibacteria group bacterium]|nr:hypothetical protein [Patescibacteria group bacterium]